jgi:hypothetical protein
MDELCRRPTEIRWGHIVPHERIHAARLTEVSFRKSLRLVDLQPYSLQNGAKQSYPVDGNDDIVPEDADLLSNARKIPPRV